MKKDFFLVSIGLGVTSLLGFIYTIFMARMLAPAQFGVFSALISLAAIIFSLGDLGIGPAIINFLPRHKHADKKIIETGYWFEYLVAVFAVLLLWSTARYANFFVPGALPEHFVLVGSLAFNYILIGYAQSVFTAEKNFLRFSLSQIIDAVLKISIVIALYYYGNLSITNALTANFASVVLALIITFWKNLWEIKTQIDKPIFHHLIEFSKWIAVSRFFSVFISRIDVLMLNLMAGSFQAGIFSAASRVTLLFAMLISSLGTVINPNLSGFEDRGQLLKYLKKVFYLTTLIFLGVVVVIIFSKEVITIVFGSEYLSAVTVLRGLSFSMTPFLYSVMTTGVLLYTLSDSRFYAMATAAQVTLIIIFDYLLIPHFGVMAPVYASGIANTFFLLASIARIAVLLKKPLPGKKVVVKDIPQSF